MSGKHHATGAQGGAVFTRNEEIYRRARRYSDRGKPFGLKGAKSNVVCSLNLNLNDLSACIGRVQLKKLSKIIARRRSFALALAERCRSLKSVTVDLGIPETEGTFWFLFFNLDLEKLSVDKDIFVAALKEEGMPVMKSYMHLFTRAEWYKNHAVFGKSGYPWASPLYKGDPDKDYPLPNCIAADASIFFMLMHENMAEKEVKDAFTILKKVEDAYLK